MNSEAVSAAGVKPRPYHAPRRAELARLTRRRITAAATELFLADGYVGTSVGRIAERAGVTPKTVYLAYKSKAQLLQTLIMQAVVGDDDDAAVVDRQDWQRMLALPPRALVRQFATGQLQVHLRTAALLSMADAAAAADPEIEQGRRLGDQLRHSDLSQVTDALARAGALRPGLTATEAADVLHVLSNVANYRAFVVDRGWGPEQYVRWLDHTLAASLLGA